METLYERRYSRPTVPVADPRIERGVLADMEVKDKVAVVTGAAGGIGRGIAERFVAEGARAVVIADVQQAALAETAEAIGAHAVVCDVTREEAVRSLVDSVEERFGAIDIFVSNAGIYIDGGEDSPDADWELSWQLHVLAHVYAARAVAAKMAARGEGYLVNTASAAGLLMHVESATYSVTKAAAVAFAEYLAVTYGPSGVRVSVLCPQAVRTAMTQGREASVASVDGMLEPAELAECVIETMREESFLILPHPQVLEYLQRKTGDYDRWLRGMARLKSKFGG